MGLWETVSPFGRGKEDLPCHCACHRTACPRMGGAINRQGGDSRRRVMASTLRGARTVEILFLFSCPAGVGNAPRAARAPGPGRGRAGGGAGSRAASIRTSIRAPGPHIHVAACDAHRSHSRKAPIRPCSQNHFARAPRVCETGALRVRKEPLHSTTLCSRSVAHHLRLSWRRVMHIAGLEARWAAQCHA